MVRLAGGGAGRPLMTGRARLTVTGVVQGVGFRPHVYRMAGVAGLSGFILNTSGGVIIEVEGEGAADFADALRNYPPPLAAISSIHVELLSPAGHTGFEIRLSEDAPGEFALVSHDIATCPDCLRELADPADRRYRYPFINCTNCGPRYSIVKGVPYDRAKTTMSAFGLCPDCAREYDDPSDRRFHAQPVACPVCGPKVEFVGTDGVRGACYGEDAVARTVDALCSGLVVAVKGLGGFHLACDATNGEAVKMLRERKRKSRKPFALMSPDVDTVRRYCAVSEREQRLLAGTVRPIVILDRLPGTNAVLAPDVAPGAVTLGFMLPYTPLHHLLFTDRGGGGFDALVMTSGNLAEEPIVINNDEAIDKLSGLADAFLLHDRAIFMRVDDSITRVVGGVPRVLRRARGYVPDAIALGSETPEILACGGELKNTLTLTKGGYAIPSQHIGDLAGLEAMRFFRETLGNLSGIFRAEPRIVAHDLHPDYLSTQFADEYADNHGGLELVPVQHHHAHVAACMADNGYDGSVIGIAFDGTGYGTDGNIWGSEFLVADYRRFTRFAHVDYIPLPGGDMAVREPWRIALSCLVMAYGTEKGQELFGRLKPGFVPAADAAVIANMAARGINSPLSCGMGRLFDAVSSLAGVRDRITYEGEAAIMLEARSREAAGETGTYSYRLKDGEPVTIDVMPLVKAVVEDALTGVNAGVTGARFHNTVAAIAVEVAEMARQRTGINVAALTGGVFQNALLLGAVHDRLTAAGFRALSHSKIPANDGCVSIGQAAVAAHVAARP